MTSLHNRHINPLILKDQGIDVTVVQGGHFFSSSTRASSLSLLMWEHMSNDKLDALVEELKK